MVYSNIKVLIVEDSPDDAELMALRMGDEGLSVDWRCVETESEYVAELQKKPDIILSDWSLPTFSGRRAFEILTQMNLAIPFIIVSGNIGEELAIETMHMGVHDYILKNHLDRLGIAVRRALENHQACIERQKAEEALRESEHRYRLLADNTIDVILTVDLELTITYVNPSIESLTGFTPQELIGRSVQEFCLPEAYSKIKSISQRALNALPQTNGFTFETEIETKDGQKKSIEITGKLLLEDQARPLAFQSVIRDISNRVLLEKKLRQAQKMESVGRLAGGIAHDFNNMLTIILGYAQMLQETVNDDRENAEKLEQIINAARRSSDLTRQLLAFARQQSITPINLILNDAISNMLKMLKRLIGEDIELIWKPAADPWTVRIDPSQLDQILANLSVNSRDAITGTGQMIIESENVTIDQFYSNSHLVAEPGDYVMLSVSDTGCGMDKDTIEKIFDPFFSTKEAGKGTGLGMSTVYGIVQQNNCFINIYSEVGHGTTIRIYLPRVVSAQETNAEKGKYELTGGTETILVVEDEQAILDLTVRILKQYGYTVLSGQTPKQALKVVQAYQGPVHLLVTDVVMPQMDGRTLEKEISLARPGLKTIFMSGYTADVVAHHGIFDKKSNYLQKPFSVQALIVKVREVLNA